MLVAVLQVLKVVSCVAGSDAQRALQPGDLLLAVNGQPVTSFPALDSLLAGLSQDDSQAAAQMLQSHKVVCTAHATAVAAYERHVRTLSISLPIALPLGRL